MMNILLRLPNLTLVLCLLAIKLITYLVATNTILILAASLASARQMA
jgi:hypothetical protein